MLVFEQSDCDLEIQVMHFLELFFKTLNILTKLQFLYTVIDEDCYEGCLCSTACSKVEFGI